MPEKGVQVIDRALDILELIASQKDGIGITDISRRLGLNKSTAHRIVTALASRGYAEKSASGNYGIGLKAVELTSRLLNSVELKTEAKPHLMQLSNNIRQPVHLGTLDGTDVIYIDKVDVLTNLRLYSQIGVRIPCYCSALGKALLINESREEIERRLAGCSFERFTENTVQSVGELYEHITHAKQSGYAVDNAEHDCSVRCIAAPVFDYRRQVIASVSIAASSDVFTPDRDAELGQCVIETAGLISRRLGYVQQ